MNNFILDPEGEIPPVKFGQMNGAIFQQAIFPSIPIPMLDGELLVGCDRHKRRW